MTEKEYIDLDTPLELKAAWGSTYRPYTSTLKELLDVNHISYTPADVRPVILCKDCKYWKSSIIEPSFYVCTYHYGVEIVRNQDDFCSRGKDRNVITNYSADMKEE